MHNVQNVCGCIGHLMKESGIETVIGAAFGAQQHHGARETMGPCNASIQDGSNASIPLQSFWETDFKSWKQICEYLEKACLHPTGRHWIDNLITPTLLAHQLLRSEREGYSIVILLHSWSPPLCQIYLVALPRDVWNSVLSDQFGQCSHPLKTDNDDLYNIFNDQVALTNVNVADSLSFGEPMVAACLNALPSGIYSKLTSPPTFDSWSAAWYRTHANIWIWVMCRSSIACGRVWLPP